jgi:hypothetical protein
MSQMLSLTKYEHEVIPGLRDQLNHAESVEDVKKFFVGTIQEFLQLATEGKLVADYDDISLQPGKSPFYSLSENVTQNDAFVALTDSDRDSVLKRLAEQAANRHKHLEKHNEKTRLKIKNH